MAQAGLFAAGILGMITAILHGYLGETRVVQPAVTPRASGKQVLRAVMFLSALYRIAAGLALVCLASQPQEPFHAPLIVGLAGVFGTAAIANF